MAAMAINSKNLKKYDFETWHEASVKGALQNLYKSCLWDDLDLLNGDVNIDNLCI